MYTAAAVHQSNGLYEATLTAEMPGVYTLTVTMTNEYQTRAGLRTVLTKSLEKVFVNGVGTSKREDYVRELQDDDSDDVSIFCELKFAHEATFSRHLIVFNRLVIFRISEVAPGIWSLRTRLV